MELTPYLIFDGDCRDALDAYAEILGGTVTMEMPHPDDPQRLAHRRLEIGDQVLHAMDSPAPGGARPSQVMLVLDDPEDAERAFAALTERGHVSVPIGPSPFAARFGMGTDRFGTTWMITAGAERTS